MSDNLVVVVLGVIKQSLGCCEGTFGSCLVMEMVDCELSSRCASHRLEDHRGNHSDSGEILLGGFVVIVCPTLGTH